MIKQIEKSIFHPHFTNQQQIGVEIEFFLIHKYTRERLYLERNHQFFQDFFTFLTVSEGFEKSKDPKTTRFCKADLGQISLEPGSQVEFASNPRGNISLLKKDLDIFFELFNRFKKQYNYKHISLFRSGYYTAGEPIDKIPIMQNQRYPRMNNYFKQFGDFADNMMKCTCALQIHFDYASEADLVEKVNRMLLMKPILLYLSANFIPKKDHCYSFRELVWKSGDPSRTGTPAAESIYKLGTWSLRSYLLKILNAPEIFPPKKENKGDFFKMLDFHISTIFTDIRVRNTIELRYLDCPKKDLLFPLIQLTCSLIYDDLFWSKFEALLPYEFHQIPEICRVINHGTQHATVLWKDVFAAPFNQLLEDYGKKKGIDFSAIIDKVHSYECLSNSKVIEQELALLYSMP